MSVRIIPREINAQVTRTLDALAVLTNEGHFSEGLKIALKKLQEVTIDPTFSTPVFPDFGKDGKLSEYDLSVKNGEFLTRFCRALEQMNIAAFKDEYKDRHDEYLPQDIDDKEMIKLLRATPPLVDQDYLSYGVSNTQSQMLMYFAKQLSDLCYNLGGETIRAFPEAVKTCLYNVANESAIAAFKVSRDYDGSAFHPQVLATDIMELSVNGDILLMQERALQTVFSPLDSHYLQGENNYHVDVRGRDNFINVLSSFYDEEITVPVAGSHTDEPKFIKQCDGMMAYKTRVSGDYKKPDHMSVMRVVKALDTVRERLRSDDSPTLLNVDGLRLTDEQKTAFVAQIEKSLHRLAGMSSDLVIPFSPEKTFHQDLELYEKRNQPNEMLYIISPSINELPARESLSQLQMRLNLALPEVAVSAEKHRQPGMNDSTINFTIHPKSDAAGVTFSDLLSAPENSFRDRLSAAIQEACHYAHSGDSKLSVELGGAFSESSSYRLLDDVVSKMPQKFTYKTSPDGAASFEIPASNELSNPNGQKGEPLVLKIESVDKLKSLAQKDNVTLYSDLSVARQVMDAMLQNNPSCASRVILAKMPASESTLHSLNHFIQRTPDPAILAAAIEYAVDNASAMWSEFTDGGRVSMVVDECHKWGVGKDYPYVLTDVVQKNIAGEHMDFGSLARLSKSIAYDFNYGKNVAIHQAKLASERIENPSVSQVTEPVVGLRR